MNFLAGLSNFALSAQGLGLISFVIFASFVAAAGHVVPRSAPILTTILCGCALSVATIISFIRS